MSDTLPPPSLLLTCPSCGEHFQVPDTFLGEVIQCPSCGQSFTAEPVAPTAPPLTSSSLRPASIPSAPPRDSAAVPPLMSYNPATATPVPPEAAGHGSPRESINLNLVQSVADIGTNLVFLDAPGGRISAPGKLLSAEGAPPADEPSRHFQTLGAVSFVRTRDPAPPAEAAPDAQADSVMGGAPKEVALKQASLQKRIRKGDLLGRYKIIDLIGEGSFGYVYLAEDSESELHTRVALKVPKSQSVSQKKLDLYRHEAKLWRALSEGRHPNVLELYNLNCFGGVIAFVMEYVEGGDLAAFARASGTLALHEALRVIGSVAAALRVIHAKRVYHGDLKPQNVLVRREDGAVKVTDFSVSRSVTDRGQVPDKLIAGTPAYMAPEVWDGKPCLQSDIFALGTLFYEIVTGARPFRGRDEATLQAAIRSGQIDGLPSERRKDLPFALERIILRCLEVNVEDRYPSVGELIEDLQEADTNQDLVSRLAECIMTHSPPEDLDFLVTRELPERGYRGDDRRTLVIEYCLDEDPTEVLLSSFSKAGLARVAEKVGATVEPGSTDREHYAQAILAKLGLGTSAPPRGIHDSVRLVNNLRHRLEQCRDAGEVAGFVAPAAREYEKVLRDLLRFYGQFLYGRFYERSLVRLARKRLAEHKRDLSRVSLGELTGILDVLNDYLAGESAEAQQFRRVFGRSYAVPPEFLTHSKVTALRNSFTHWNETLAQANLMKIRDTARELLGEVCAFLQTIADGGVYPRIVAVESFVTDRFGRRYVFCRNDQGQLEKVFTNVAIDPSRHYFFYPTTNPMRIYPILVPT